MAPDGRRFVMIKDADDPPAMVTVLNWFEELKKLLPRSAIDRIGPS